MLTANTAKLLRELIPSMQKVLYISETMNSTIADKLLLMFKVLKREHFPEDGTLYLSLKVRDFLKEQIGYYIFH